MTTYLVTHASLADDHERLARWLAALAKVGIHQPVLRRLDRAGWSDGIRQADRVLALGGDGTQSAVAGVCVAHGALQGVLPAGTGNDFARSLGIPLNMTGACEVLLRGEERRVDVGLVNGRCYLNVAHAGLGAQVGLRIPSSLKQRWGPLSYLRRLVALVRRKRGFWGRIEYDGQVIYGRWLEIAVANGPYFGGGHMITQACLTNGSLTLVCVRARPLYRLLLAWFFSRLGRPLNRKVLRFERVKQCRLDTHRHRSISADGEAAGHTPMVCQAKADALRVMASTP